MVSSHLLLLFLPYPLIFSSMMWRPRWTSLRTSRPLALELQVILSDFSNTTLLDVIRTRGWESLCERLVHCPIQEFYSNIRSIDTSVPQFTMRFKGTRIVVSLDLVAKVLRVPSVVHPNYPGCEPVTISGLCLETNSSPICGTPSIWGGRLNTPSSGFAKGPRFLNMVMTFTLTPLSHYNSITEPYARFLLSLLEDLTINFPSHFNTSIIVVYQDTTTSDKLIFPLAITQILQHFSIPIPLSSLFTIIGAISVGSVQRSKAQLQSK